MNGAIVVCTLCAVLSSSLLENAGAQTRNQPDSWSFIQSMERLSKVVEDLQTKIELQESKLNNLVTKEELESILLNNLATKADMQTQETSLRNSLEANAALHETKLDELTTLLTNLNVKEEEQAASLRNLEGESKLQSTSIDKLEDKIDIQSTSLNTLVNKEEWQQPVPLYTTNQTVVTINGDDVEIWCVVHGTPLPEIKWTRANGMLASNRVEYGNNGKALRIKNVGWSDEDTYVCVAANGVGTPVSQTFSLEVQGPGLIAGTSSGLIALNLRTLEATTLTSQYVLAVAVNPKLKKVYWSESSRIVRSNFDGSAEEIIVSQTEGSNIHMMAIHEPSGNVYFARYSSHEITTCNALGKNRTAIISNSSLVNNPVAIALDSDNSVMYWGGDGTPNYLVRANLDGSNAKIISTAFRALYGITLDQRSNGVLYWVDFTEKTVGAIDVHGGNKRTLVKLEGNDRPWGIQVDAHKIYFSNHYGKTIQSVDKASGKELTAIYNSGGNNYHLALLNVST